ncbi:MAG: peptide chain release factor N(5)-glutamine methyltransferase [Bacteroidales bacterium]|nr:peptide chain release factor N(5)-glutamine methyltransferase [Bacteroidales bacterium]
MTTSNHTIRDCRNLIATELGRLYPSGEIRAMTSIILTHLTGRSSSSLLADPSYRVPDQAWHKINQICDDLKLYKPLQYILGFTEFYGRRFKVSPDVLIPRPETEELAELVISENSEPGLRVLDIGTGSGVLAVTLALGMDNPAVSALDIDIGALAVAAENAAAHGADIIFSRSDILNPAPGNSSFDLIVSNPPYIRESEKALISRNVLDYEPHHALFVPDSNPLMFYKAIFSYAGKHLTEGGKIYLEINEALGRETELIAWELGYSTTRIVSDINGKERFIAAE